ncbi:MAG TPA: OsmC family protein [Nitrospira sp.]|nr:OsmC family protein [Nitrospira sp.]
MRLTVAYHSGTRHDITSGKHRVITDQPVEDGGQDAGVSPVELFVGAVASCVSYFVGRFCARHNIPRDGMTVDAEWFMTDGPHRVGRINLSIHVPRRLTQDQKEKLLKVAHGCTVHQSVAVAPKVAIDLNPDSREGKQMKEPDEITKD